MISLNCLNDDDNPSVNTNIDLNTNYSNPINSQRRIIPGRKILIQPIEKGFTVQINIKLKRMSLSIFNELVNVPVLR